MKRPWGVFKFKGRGVAAGFCALMLSLSVAASAADPEDSPERPPALSKRFGVLDFFYWNHNWNDYQYPDEASIDRALELTARAGFGGVRVDIPWREVEPEKGRWDFAVFDGIVRKFRQRGLEITAMLQYSPEWTGRSWNDPPDLEGFLEYAAQTARRYRGEVDSWEIWNEPDSPIYWSAQDRMKAYTELLKAVYPVIKREDPSSRVLIGGLTRYPAASLKMIYQNGGKEFFDIANVHPFQDPLSAGAAGRVAGILRGVRKVMEAQGDGSKPIWITEIGCPGLAAGETSRGWWFGRGASESEQAAWAAAVLEQSQDWDTQKIFWAFLRDTRHFGNDIDRFGIVRRDGTPKPAYDVFKTHLSNPEIQV